MKIALNEGLEKFHLASKHLNQSHSELLSASEKMNVLCNELSIDPRNSSYAIMTRNDIFKASADLRTEWITQMEFLGHIRKLHNVMISQSDIIQSYIGVHANDLFAVIEQCRAYQLRHGQINDSPFRFSKSFNFFRVYGETCM